MHVCQILLVEADSAESAFSDVQSAIQYSDYQYPSWSDWNNVGDEPTNFSGRWTGEVFTELKDPKTGEVPNILCYSDDPALADKVISTWLEGRFSSIKEYQPKAVDLATQKYDPYTMGFSMDLYYTVKLAEILNDTWTSDSGVYDLSAHTPNLYAFTQRVKTNPTQQYLVPVDFHF